MFRSFASVMLMTVSLLVVRPIPAFGQNNSRTASNQQEEAKALQACARAVIDQAGLLKIPKTRDLRFQGKVSEATALCRGGEQALQFRGHPGWIGAIIGERATCLPCRPALSPRSFQLNAAWPEHFWILNCSGSN